MEGREETRNTRRGEEHSERISGDDGMRRVDGRGGCAGVEEEMVREGRDETKTESEKGVEGKRAKGRMARARERESAKKGERERGRDDRSW